MGAEHGERIAALREKLAGTGAQSWLSLSEPDNFYFTGFTGEQSAVIVTGDDAVFMCDPRFTEQARDEVTECRVQEVRGNFLGGVGKIAAGLDVFPLAYDPHAMTVGRLEVLQETAGGTFLPVLNLAGRLRMVKSNEEIARIGAASELAEGVLQDVVAGIEPGVAEMELAARIEYEFKRRGASGPSFPTIVLFGARSSLPHGQPGERELRRGDVVLIDMGCRKAGYCSDLTRTYAYDTIPGAWFDKVYRVVLAAQQAALGRVRAGVSCRDVDALARDIIEKAGFGKYFGHGLGHGVGIEVHESPRLNFESDTVLEPGMVVTVEPGIYMPGEGGVRIEDMVVVTEKGCDILTRTPTKLKVL